MFRRHTFMKGTWEELAAYEPELRGRKLRLIVIPDIPITLHFKTDVPFLDYRLRSAVTCSPYRRRR